MVSKARFKTADEAMAWYNGWLRTLPPPPQKDNCRECSDDFGGWDPVFKAYLPDGRPVYWYIVGTAGAESLVVEGEETVRSWGNQYYYYCARINGEDHSEKVLELAELPEKDVPDDLEPSTPESVFWARQAGVEAGAPSILGIARPDPASPSGPGYDMDLPSTPPFMYVESHEELGDLGVISFGAYNAMGLIGSEKGGVAIVFEEPVKGVFATKDIPWDPKARAHEAERVTEIIEEILKPSKRGRQAVKILPQGHRGYRLRIRTCSRQGTYRHGQPESYP